MSLREAIQAVHDLAERHALTVTMFSGKLPPAAYADLLANLIPIYSRIEGSAQSYGLLQGLDGIERVERLNDDLDELLEMTQAEVSIFPCAMRHMDRIGVLDKQGVLAHLYVQHMGDMYGGQMLAQKLPGSCTRYEFENRSALIAGIRAMLTDDLADEAIECFKYTLDLYDAIADKHNLWAAGRSEADAA